MFEGPSSASPEAYRKLEETVKQYQNGIEERDKTPGLGGTRPGEIQETPPSDTPEQLTTRAENLGQSISIDAIKDNQVIVELGPLKIRLKKTPLAENEGVGNKYSLRITAENDNVQVYFSNTPEIHDNWEFKDVQDGQNSISLLSGQSMQVLYGGQTYEYYLLETPPGTAHFELKTVAPHSTSPELAK